MQNVQTEKEFVRLKTNTCRELKRYNALMVNSHCKRKSTLYQPHFLCELMNVCTVRNGLRMKSKFFPVTSNHFASSNTFFSFCTMTKINSCFRSRNTLQICARCYFSSSSFFVSFSQAFLAAVQIAPFKIRNDTLKLKKSKYLMRHRRLKRRQKGG